MFQFYLTGVATKQRPDTPTALEPGQCLDSSFRSRSGGSLLLQGLDAQGGGLAKAGVRTGRHLQDLARKFAPAPRFVSVHLPLNTFMVTLNVFFQGCGVLRALIIFYIQWKPLNVIIDNVFTDIKCFQIDQVPNNCPLVILYQLEASYCHHLVNVITFICHALSGFYCNTFFLEERFQACFCICLFDLN